MRIVMTNPRLRCGLRRRHSTVLVLEEFGHHVELVFTSLQALERLADMVSEACDKLADGQAGTEWWNPGIEESRRAAPSAGLLREEELIDTPEFLRRRSSAEHRLKSSVTVKKSGQ